MIKHVYKITPKIAVIRAIAGRVLFTIVAIITIILINSFFTSIVILIFMTGTCWMLMYLLRFISDYRAVSYLIQSEKYGLNTPIKQGKWTAVAGKTILLTQYIKPTFPEIIAYQYKIADEVYRDSSDKSITNTMMALRNEGYYLVPSAIKSNFGIIKLRGFPDLTHLKKMPLPKAVLTDLDKLSIRSKFPRFYHRAWALAEFENSVRIDWKHTETSHQENFTLKTLVTAKVLKINENICAIGCWNQGELVPSIFRPRGVTIYPKTPIEVQKQLRQNIHDFSIIATISLVISTLVFWYFGV